MKKLIQALLARSGYDLFKRDARFHPGLCAARTAGRLGVGTVLDVGANVGQFGRELREWGYRGRILSFEPLSEAHRKLQEAASQDPAWDVAPRCAVGAARSISQINISANSVSSSLLDMMEVHQQASPRSAYTGREEVEVLPLDELVSGLCAPGESLYLKIDTQGYEKAVLEGAGTILPRCVAVQLELSLRPLYSGGFLFEEGIGWMSRAGFRLYAVYPGFSDRESGETFQMDGIFVRCDPPQDASSPVQA